MLAIPNKAKALKMKIDNVLIVLSVALGSFGIYSAESAITWFCGAVMAGVLIAFNDWGILTMTESQWLVLGCIVYAVVLAWGLV